VIARAGEDTDTDLVVLLANDTIPHSGTIQKWEIYTKTKGAVTLQVWR